MLKKTSSLFFISLLGVSLALVAGEIYLRSINFPYDGCQQTHLLSEALYGQFDLDLGWNYIPSVSKTGDHGARYTFNKEGFRSLSLDYQRDLSKPTILIVGDSMLFGHGLNFADTFGYKLQKALSDKYEVLNFAVQGYGVDQSYLMLKKVFPKYQPQIVITDFIGDYGRNVNRDRREFQKCAVTSGTKPLFELKNGRLVQTHKPELFDSYDNPRVRLLFRRALNNFKPQDPKKSQEVTKELLTEMDSYVNANGALMYMINIDSNEHTLKNSQVLGVSISRSEQSVNPYIISQSDPHPSSLATTYMVAEMVNRLEDKDTVENSSQY